MLPRPATMITAVVVTFAIAGVMKLSTRGMTSAAPDPEGLRDETPAQIESSRYQREITDLEAVLYQEAPPSMTDFMSISAALHEMGFAIADREMGPGARDVASSVAMLAAQSEVGEAGYALPDIAQLRHDWEALRSEHFSDEEWFRESTPAVESAQEVPAPTIDPSMIEDLLRAIDAIEALSDEGRRACEELGEPSYDFEQPGAEGEAHIEKWNDFARDWDEDVTRVATRLPSPPSWDADPELTAAYQDVTFAIRELRNATMGPGSWPVPFEGDWTARFDEAERLLSQARERLAQ
ncbi:MAG TPA: hypothetical protein VEC56_08185 [Candidatus Krumholzibacteria bacterium]|nr:hypothetical protein [Candidatus Krumholzibacteria bacterium]